VEPAVVAELNTIRGHLGTTSLSLSLFVVIVKAEKTKKKKKRNSTVSVTFTMDFLKEEDLSPGFLLQAVLSAETFT
jgi:hypothetical protein